MESAAQTMPGRSMSCTGVMSAFALPMFDCRKGMSAQASWKSVGGQHANYQGESSKEGCGFQFHKIG
jgi:hypothetical protein